MTESLGFHLLMLYNKQIFRNQQHGGIISINYKQKKNEVL